MSTIIHLDDIHFDGDRLVVTAVVEDAAVTRRQTDLDPEEYGPALCRGTMHFSDDDKIPATDRDLMTMLEQRIRDWELVDETDTDGDS